MDTGVHVHATVMDVAWTRSFWKTWRGHGHGHRISRKSWCGHGHGHGVKPGPPNSVVVYDLKNLQSNNLSKPLTHQLK